MASLRCTLCMVLFVLSVMDVAKVEAKALEPSTVLESITAVDPDKETAAIGRATQQGMFASVQGTNTAIVLGVGYAVMMLLSYGFPAEGEIVGRSLRSFQSRNSTEELAEDVGFFSTLLNIFDPVDIGFNYMEIENSACRKRSVCQISGTPFIGQFLRYISPNIRSLTDYEDAMSAGEAWEDCNLVFAECPENHYVSEK